MDITLEELILVTLSFYEPMTFSQIIIDFDAEKLKQFPEFDREQLQSILNTLENKKILKKVKIDKESGWIKVLPKKSFFKKYSYKI